MSSIFIIEESPNPGVWNVVQSRGMYKSKIRAEKAAKEITRWNMENIRPGDRSFGFRYRVTEYRPEGEGCGEG